MPDLRLGPWQEALADVDEVDTLITDPPYGGRTHDGHNRAKEQVEGVTKQLIRRSISYEHWTPDDVSEFCEHWIPRTRGWFCAMTSHDLIPSFEEAFKRHDRYSFAPLPAPQPPSDNPVPIYSHRARLLGDGPSCAVVFLVVARPRTSEFSRWGCLPGWYHPQKEVGGHIGGKPLNLMQRIVGDYTNPGDQVCDPFAGYGTTLLAAASLSCYSIGSEVDVETYEKAKARLAKGYTLGIHPRAKKFLPKAHQESLF